MRNLQLFESYVELIQEKKKEEKKKKKDLKWINKALDDDKSSGKLHKVLDIPKDEKIPDDKINSKIEELEKSAEGDKKLSKKERKLLRRLVLAKTLKSL